MKKLVVLDAGGQYCHLIARRLRHFGIYADVKPCSTPSADLTGYKGIIVSGGPSSVYEHSSPKLDPGVLDLNTPILGICYGHQLLAKMLGGTVARGKVAEYGLSRLSVVTEDSIFKSSPRTRSVWMSHRDLVTAVPEGFELLAKTSSCPVAAMGDHSRKIYGLQFHPEVVHTERGNEILRSFCVDVCGCKPREWRPAEQINALIDQIRSTAAGKNVFFFISGGVDSTVAFLLCFQALGAERVEGVFVDTGFMRDTDIDDIRFLKETEHARIHIEPARKEFVDLLTSVYSPEKKRRVIGEHFLAVHERILADRFATQSDQWMLGQGTIYPDTIESGGTQHSSKIKTHHNRVGTVLQMLQDGRVLEPLAQFYKDEVRDIGRALNISERILNKQPFPGPGLAIRCICSAKGTTPRRNPVITEIARVHGFDGVKLDLKTVGVKGDERSYESIAVLSGAGEFDRLESVSTKITNRVVDVTRVLYLVSDSTFELGHWRVVRSCVNSARLEKLRRADSIVRNHMLSEYPHLMSKIWQFPVILLPFVNSQCAKESIVLRPVDSIDGMTASFTKLDKFVLRNLANKLHRELGVATLFDITNKPPATIEWE